MQISTNLNLNGSHPRDLDCLPIETIVDEIAKAREKNWEGCSKKWGGYSVDNETREGLILREKVLRKRASKYPPNWDSYEAAGGIKWTMGLEKIETFVQDKFDELRQTGILMFRSEFEKNENPSHFRTTGKIFKEGQKRRELDRLWVAEYLRKELAHVELYKVPRVIVIIEDNVKSLPVSLWPYGPAILITEFGEECGEVLIENIEDGIPAANMSSHMPLREAGYVDFSDSGNILKGKDGKYYVVDTDWKSVSDGLAAKRDQNGTISTLRAYAQERFQAFYADLKPIHVDLSGPLYQKV